MFAKKFLQKKALSGCHDLHHSCAVRLLDASDLISVTFQVKSRYQKSGVTGRFAPLTFRPLDVSPLHWTFRPWTFRPLYVSPLGRFAPRTFRPCTFRHLSPPGRFAHSLDDSPPTVDVSPPSAFLCVCCF